MNFIRYPFGFLKRVIIMWPVRKQTFIIKVIVPTLSEVMEDKARFMALKALTPMAAFIDKLTPKADMI